MKSSMEVGTSWFNAFPSFENSVGVISGVFSQGMQLRIQSPLRGWPIIILTDVCDFMIVLFAK